MPQNSLYNTLRSWLLHKYPPEKVMTAQDVVRIVDDLVTLMQGIQVVQDGILLPDTKGQIITHDGTQPTLQDVGANGRITYSDDTQLNGWYWADPSVLGFLTALLVRLNGTDVASQPALNFVDNSVVEFGVTNDAGNNEIDIEANVVGTSALIIPTITGTTSAMADNGTYYWGSSGAFGVNTNQGLARIYNRTGKTLTIVAISTFIRWTVGTSETATVYLRYNNTTDYSLGTVAGNVAQTELSLTGQSISWASGDYVEMKIVNPTWVTNPSGMSAGGQIHCLSPIS